MKKILRIVLWIVAGLVVLIAGLMALIASRGVPTYDLPVTENVRIEATATRLNRGENIVQMLCIGCHLGKDNKLSGKHMADAPKEFGTIYSANITHDKEKGIGNWTNGELIYFLRTGIMRDGRFNPIMPKFPLMADEDINAVIAFLRSDNILVQASKEEPPQTEYNFLVKVLTNTLIKPLPIPNQPITIPDSTNKVLFGQYMADAVVGCYGCHSADFKDQNPIDPKQSKGYYGGGNPMINEKGEIVPSANLTMDEETGIGKKYDKALFVRAVKQAVGHDGRILRYPMTPHSTLTDYEAGAIFEYLKTIPRLTNKVAGTL